ncbi:group III truncated hemoglobin [Novosphingobium rosa]|uniref:group III truncated hemoglobin n=1 Tax=Novosphingobium rosa TaxID=76978 RepID=UPI0008331F1E|nr:group III truncated hemoglobin [Novosphingobium rosa]
MTLNALPQPGPSPVMDRHPDIARLVRLFYERARQDSLIGPVFEGIIHDWEGHFRAFTAFWAAQLRGRGRYRGQPVAPHVALASSITPDMFARRLTLWRTAAAEVMAPQDAALLTEKAQRITQVLQQAVADTRTEGETRP